MNEAQIAGEPIATQPPKVYKTQVKEEKFEVSKANFELLTHIKETYKENFHKRRSIDFKVGKQRIYASNLNFYGSVTGCGLMIMTGNSMLAHDVSRLNKDSLDLYEQLIKDIKESGVGAVLCTIGDTGKTKQHDRLMELLGFTLLTSYINWRHNPKYKQYLYIKILE